MSDVSREKTEQPHQSTNHPIDATIPFTDPSRERSADGLRITKQNLDLAFATSLMRAGNISQRRLAEAITNWTTHGNESLAEHLVAKKVILPGRMKVLEKEANRRVERILAELSEEGNNGGSQRDRSLITRLDASGRIAKLLGLADASVLSADQMESRTIGARYTLLRRLGQGGIGTVWLARDENLRRYVAVKEVTRKVEANDPALAHFRREAEITGQLEHPGIVPVYQYGTDEETGRSFYAMRFLGKRTLQDAIAEYHEQREAGNEDRMLMHRLLTAFVNVCLAVAHAHTRKIIHRDLKPENIAIDSFGQIVLLDWGLAKINDETGMYDANGQAEPGDLHNVGSTHAGRVLGTPLYMAPEQAAGRLEEVDERTDVYGLGGILYCILTGEAPHQRTIDLPHGARKNSEVFATIVAANITAPNKIHDHVSAELAAICSKALANKRYLRYASAKELADDVERFRAGTPVSAYDAPLQRRAARWMAKHPTMTQLLLLMTVLTVLGGAAIGYIARRGDLALQEARYESLMDFARELELNLQFETQELVQDARFVTDFPLMRAITTSQRPASLESGIVVEGDTAINVTEVSPEEWLDRHGRLLDSLLDANPSYLTASTVRCEKPTMSELVRSERMSVGMRPRRVPRQQLFVGEHQESDDELFRLRPGQVAITTGDHLAKEVPTNNRSPLVLIAVCPVFDETGAFFGINVLELDLRRRIEELFLAVRHDGMEVYVTDGAGKIALHYRNGHSVPTSVEANVVRAYPELRAVFAEQAENEFGDDKSLHAVRVRLGEEVSTAHFGIVTKILDKDEA